MIAEKQPVHAKPTHCLVERGEGGGYGRRVSRHAREELLHSDLDGWTSHSDVL